MNQWLQREQRFKRLALKVWAQDAVALHASFRESVLMGTLHPEGVPTTAFLRRTLVASMGEGKADMILEMIPSDVNRALFLQELRPRPALARLRAQADALQLVAAYVGVLVGRELRIACDFFFKFDGPGLNSSKLYCRVFG